MAEPVTIWASRSTSSVPTRYARHRLQIWRQGESIVTTQGFEDVVERYDAMMDHFARGDSGPAKEFFSMQSDVTLANPFGPAVTGREAVERAVDAAAANYKDGKAVRFE